MAQRQEGRLTRSAIKPVSDRLFDCCWVELEGYARPELVIQKRLKPKIFAIDEFLYDERGTAISDGAPTIQVIYNTTIAPRRKMA